MEEERLYQIILEYVIKFKKSEYEFGQSMTDRGICYIPQENKI